MTRFDLIVIGGGAAGFYGAIQAAQQNRRLGIVILEKTGKLLSKVRISGGGRCNVTHNCFNPTRLAQHYPRGTKSLKKVFQEYDVQDTVGWFTSQGVDLKTEDDGRMFPRSDRSETIIACLMRAAESLGIRIQTEAEVTGLQRVDSEFRITIRDGSSFRSRFVLVATGGTPKSEGYAFIQALGHTIRKPIPSLFTFNDAQKHFADLMGVSVSGAEVKIAGSRFQQEGPLLITHWGLSGPAVIRLSAWAAEYLHDLQYQFIALVSWIGPQTEDEVRQLLMHQKQVRLKQKVYLHPLFELPMRLWVRLCEVSQIPEEKIWGDLSNKNINKLLENLIRCPFSIKGKTTFKEEFVTCGGVDLKEIDTGTMESRKVRGLYFAGEVLDIDGETGGFNFQAAWSTASVAATAIAASEH